MHMYIRKSTLAAFFNAAALPPDIYDVVKRRRHGLLQLPPVVDVVDGRLYVFVGSHRFA